MGPLWLLSCASDSAPSVVVQLQTDLVAGEEFDTVELRLVHTRSGRPYVANEVAAVGSFVPAQRLLEFKDVAAGDHQLEVILRSKQHDRLVRSHTALLSVEKSVAVTVPVSRSCLNVRCGEGEACLSGRCVDARCTLETPEFCDGPGGCEVDSDCEAPVGCATGLCSSGQCWSASGAGATNSCERPSEWCHPVLGCLESGDDHGLIGSADDFAHCENGVHDGDEFETDCGGRCGPCNATGYDCSAQSNVPTSECEALTAIYDVVAPDSRHLLEGWAQAPNPCTWLGVLCDGGHIRTLSFPNGTGVAGSLPPEVGNLVFLSTLDLSVSGFTGSLPAELSQLRSLEILDLYFSSFTGPVPEELGGLTELRHLNMSSVALTGTIPESLGQLRHLQYLSFRSSTNYGPRLHGTIPETLGDLTRLEVLDLHNNLLSGEVPVAFLRLTQIEELNLSLNRCLWTTSCEELKPWLDAQNPDWSFTPFTDSNCTPPDGACQ